jgi:hypothetical protein
MNVFPHPTGHAAVCRCLVELGRRLLIKPCRGLVGLQGGSAGWLGQVASHRSDLLYRQLPGPHVRSRTG